MFKVKSIVKETAEETTPEPLFEPLKYHQEEVEKVSVRLPGYPIMSFLARTRDVAGGVATILEIRERNVTVTSFENPQVFLRLGDGWNLARLSIAALELLRDETDKLTKWAYKYHTPEGRAEHGHPNL